MKNKMLGIALLVVFIILGVLNKDAQAAELELGAWTTHMISDNNTINNDNRLVGVSYKGFEAATFINSFEDRSFALGYRIELPSIFSVSMGIIEGYGENSKHFPVRQSHTVFYASANATVEVMDHFAVRGRVMGEVFMMSGVVKF